MGASLVYLDKPNKTKETQVGYGNEVSYAVSSMQGWRLNMEDAHICTVDKYTGNIFGVFDGHGGVEVAHFVSKHFESEFKDNINYKMKNYDMALQDTFLRMDELLSTNKGK